MTTKTLQDFMAENKKTFAFKLWIANTELTSDMLDRIETSLQKFKLENISKPKSQPTTDHKFFPGLGAVEIKTIELELSYPCNASQIYDTILRSGIALPGHNLVVVNRGMPDSKDRYNTDHFPPKEALLNSDYEDSDNSELYGEKQTSSFLKSLTSRKFEFEKANTEKTKSTNDTAIGKTSPVGSNKTARPSLPKTGSKK